VRAQAWDAATEPHAVVCGAVTPLAAGESGLRLKLSTRPRLEASAGLLVLLLLLLLMRVRLESRLPLSGPWCARWFRDCGYG